MGTVFIQPTTSTSGFDSDLELLRKIVLFIRRFLDWILRQNRMFPNPEDRELLTQEFNTVIQNAFEQLLARLNDRSEDGLRELSQTLTAGGLTGISLKMKSELLNRDIKRKDWKRVFHRIKSILGSLRLPGVEFIKEFKEHVKITVDNLQEHDEDAPQAVSD